MFPQNNWAGKGLTHSDLVIPDSVIDRTWSTSAQVMAWCLTAPSHYLNQYWILTSEVLWHSHEGFFSEKKSRYLSLTWLFKITILRLQLHLPRANELRLYVYIGYRADSRFAPSQCETSSQSNAVSHWLGTNLESALIGDSNALGLLLNLLQEQHRDQVVFSVMTRLFVKLISGPKCWTSTVQLSSWQIGYAEENTCGLQRFENPSINYASDMKYFVSWEMKQYYLMCYCKILIHWINFMMQMTVIKDLCFYNLAVYWHISCMHHASYIWKGHSVYTIIGT